jgi:DNA-binding NarL/FixJ family response regulator
LGYVLKARAGTDLEPAIRAALAGQTILSPGLVTALATARGPAA